jgi:5-carboxyvanillate decarboxylase
MSNSRRSLLKAAAAGATSLVGAATAAQAQLPKTGVWARKYRRIATEEGYNHPEFLAAQRKYLLTATDEPGQKGGGGTIPGLTDLPERLRVMDEGGIAMQVLLVSSPGVQVFQAPEAVAMSIMINDFAAADCKAHPTRFVFLAAVPPQDPAAAVKELDRAVNKLGARGAVINSHTKGEYLDDPKFWPIFEAAQAMDVPIYIHPREPSPAMLKPYTAYPSLPTAMWGYAAETGLHSMRLILGGVFDQFPKLKIVIGHVGENIPFTLDRIDNRYKIAYARSGAPRPIKRLPSEYFHSNFHITTSGANWPPGVKFCQQVLGVDKVLFAVDYPYEDTNSTVAQSDTIPLTDAEALAFFQTNAERVFKIKA